MEEVPSPVAVRGENPILHNKYEIGRQLGHGTFAKVHLARHLQTGETLALKVISKEKIIKIGMIDQIKREISTMKAVSAHPNIVSLREVLATKSKIYLAMDLVRGGELFSKISRHGRLTETAARSYFRQLISAVDFCHSRGVFHRDLKLENLLLDDIGNLKIADFGLSAFTNNLHADGLFHTTCGTPAYVAPEVITKKGYDGAKADVWSCGVILYVILSGGLPFRDENLASLYKKIVRADFRCPPFLSTAARRLLVRLLDPNPGTRISMPEILKSAWLAMPRSTSAPEFRHVSSAPEAMNAFHIIGMARGLNLGGLFEEEDGGDVVARLEEMVESAGRRRGATGQEWLTVEVKNDGVDALEYKSFCSDELRPALKDIVWAAAADSQPVVGAS